MDSLEQTCVLLPSQVSSGRSFHCFLILSARLSTLAHLFIPLSPLDMPSFIKSPDDQTGISGGVASFVCQAAGDPRPRITWMKKGKKVSSQRFEVEFSWKQRQFPEWCFACADLHFLPFTSH